MLQRIVAVVLLALVYAAALASFAPADLALGALLGAALTRRYGAFVFRAEPRPLRELPGRAAALPPLAWAVTRSVFTGTWQVARAVVRPSSLRRPGIVTVTLPEAQAEGVEMCALLLTLSPGSLAVDVDAEHRRIHLHVLDATDPDAARRDVERFYRRYQRKVFP